MNRVFSKRPYLSRADQVTFKRMLDSGEANFFNTKACARCEKDVPSTKTYCSLSCYEKESKNATEVDTAEDDAEEDE